MMSYVVKGLAGIATWFFSVPSSIFSTSPFSIARGYSSVIYSASLSNSPALIFSKHLYSVMPRDSLTTYNTHLIVKALALTF
jgi:hypothetical protein